MDQTPVVSEAELVAVRPEKEIVSKQGLPNFMGISQESAGATGLCMHIVVIPPGGQAEPHLHNGYETTIYLLEGRVLTKYGSNLEKSIINEAGDFLFIPANVPHQPINLSDSLPARAIIARNDPNEQESVLLYPEETGA